MVLVWCRFGSPGSTIVSICVQVLELRALAASLNVSNDHVLPSFTKQLGALGGLDLVRGAR